MINMAATEAFAKLKTLADLSASKPARGLAAAVTLGSSASAGGVASCAEPHGPMLMMDDAPMLPPLVGGGLMAVNTNANLSVFDQMAEADLAAVKEDWDDFADETTAPKQPPPVPPARVAAAHDFGDFDDAAPAAPELDDGFGAFRAVPSATPTAADGAVPTTPASDEFGTFGDFDSAPTNPATPSSGDASGNPFDVLSSPPAVQAHPPSRRLPPSTWVPSAMGQAAAARPYRQALIRRWRSCRLTSERNSSRRSARRSESPTHRPPRSCRRSRHHLRQAAASARLEASAPRPRRRCVLRRHHPRRMATLALLETCAPRPCSLQRTADLVHLAPPRHRLQRSWTTASAHLAPRARSPRPWSRWTTSLATLATRTMRRRLDAAAAELAAAEAAVGEAAAVEAAAAAAEAAAADPFSALGPNVMGAGASVSSRQRVHSQRRRPRPSSRPHDLRRRTKWQPHTGPRPWLHAIRHSTVTRPRCAHCSYAAQADSTTHACAEHAAAVVARDAARAAKADAAVNERFEEAIALREKIAALERALRLMQTSQRGATLVRRDGELSASTRCTWRSPRRPRRQRDACAACTRSPRAHGGANAAGVLYAADDGLGELAALAHEDTRAARRAQREQLRVRRARACGTRRRRSAARAARLGST